MREGLEKGKLGFLLRGEKVKGSFALVRSSDKKNWFLIKHKDRYAAKTDITAQNRSVLCGMAVEDLKAHPVQRIPASRLVPTGEIEAMPASLSPMQAELGEAPFNHADWMWEPKLDGYRVLAFIGEEGVKLRSRRGLELAAVFPRLTAELGKQAVRSMILDGEIVAFDASGKPSFGALQNRAQLKTEREIAAADQNVAVVFYCFDLLHFAGVDLRKSPYRDRRRYLSQCLLPSPLVQLVHAQDDGLTLNAAALASGFEGVIGKRTDSKYEAGRRSASWLKIKSTNSGGVRRRRLHQGQGIARAARRVAGRLLGRGQAPLRFARRLGIRWGHARAGEGPTGPATNQHLSIRRKARTQRPDHLGQAEVVVEVQFQNWTDDGSLRAPVFLRLRDDVDPKSVQRSTSGRTPHASAAPRANSEIDDVVRQLENKKAAFTIAVGPHQIRFTNLDRVYWPADRALKQPALTKRDLLRYFAQVSPFILPHLADRPLTMIRMPEGIDGQRFFQKHWEQERPEFVETITVFSEHKDERHDYLLCNSLPTLLWLAQSGTLEFHVWHSRAKPGPDAASKSTDYAASAAALEGSVLNYPDYVVFDIDPYIYSGKEAKGAEPELNTVAFEKGKEVAFWLRELLQSMSPRIHRQDLGQDRAARFRADPAHPRFRCRAPGLRARRSAPDAPTPEGHHHGMERAQADRQDFHGQIRNHSRQDAECRLLAERCPRRAGARCRSRGKSWQTRTRSTSGSPTPRCVWPKRAIAGATRWPVNRALNARWNARSASKEEVSMAARSIASLTISFGLVSIP